MKKYEYKYIALNGFKNTDAVEEMLNAYGNEGWELVGVWVQYYYFKREILD